MILMDNKIIFGTLSGGRNSGMLAFRLDVSGEGPENGMSEVAEVIERIRTHPAGISKLISVTGVFTSENDVALFTLCKSLTDLGYQILTESDGSSYRQWFQFVNYLKVRVGNELWAGFKCNELIFEMNDDGISEPTLPEVHSNFMAYIVPGERVTPAGLFSFIRDSKIVWSLYSRNQYSYLVKEIEE